MAKWIEKPCLEILKKLNEIPFEEGREDRQLTILMSGISNITREMMKRAAESARLQIAESGSFGEEPISKSGSKTPEVAESADSELDDTPDLEDFDSFDEELDLIEQTLIRSIGD